MGVKSNGVFIPKYNMLHHYRQVHGLGSEEESKMDAKMYKISDEEGKVTAKILIKVIEDGDMEENASDGAC